MSELVSKTKHITVKKLNENCFRLNFDNYNDFLETQLCDTSYYSKEYLKYRPDRYSKPKEEFVLERILFSKSNISPFDKFRNNNAIAYERALKQDKDPMFKRYQEYDKHLAGNIFNQIFGSKVPVDNKELLANKTIYVDTVNHLIQVCPDGFVEIEGKRYLVHCFRDDANKVDFEDKMSLLAIYDNKNNFQLLKGVYDFVLLNHFGEKVDGIYFCKVNRPDFFRSIRYHTPRQEENIELRLVDIDKDDVPKITERCINELGDNSGKTHTLAKTLCGDSGFDLTLEAQLILEKKLEGHSFVKKKEAKKNDKDKEKDYVF